MSADLASCWAGALPIPFRKCPDGQTESNGMQCPDGQTGKKLHLYSYNLCEAQ